MSITQLTKSPTEADLEARIEASVRAAFSWLPPDGLKHQLKFEFKFGHSVVAVDGAEVSAAQARLDILVSYKGIPLAVMELKREGLPLTADDEEQGLSYARMLHPRPPLVVVTNGTDTKTLETHSGAQWKADNPTEAAVNKLIANAGTIAAGDLKRAVESLLGPQSMVWVAAVRAASDAAIADLTGQFDEVSRPFVEDFLIPRNATRQIVDALSSSKRIVIVEGPPLAGKSNVLRELAEVTRESKELVIFFIEADGGGGAGVFQIIANVMAGALGWNVTADDTRAWLRSLSRQSGPKLVFAIDGISATRDEVRRDIEELTADAFGPNLRLVLAMDDAVTPRVVKSETGRKATRIGRRAAVVSVDALADNEFRRAVGVLLDRRIGIIHGGEHAPEYRVPWAVRALASDVTASPRYADQSVMAGLPPLLGPQLLHQVRQRFQEEEETRHLFQGLAEAALEDVADRKRSVVTVLESMANYAIRRKTVRKHIDGAELAALSKRGFVKLTLNEANEQIVVTRLPELLESELAFLLGRRLAEQIEENGPKEAADWLVEQSSRLPFGDVIAAQAIFDCAMEAGSLSLSLIQRLLAVPPRKEKIKPGTRAALFMPDIGKIELTFRDDSRIVARIGPYEKILDAEEGDESAQEMYGDIEGWLILSHLAGHPCMAQSQDGAQLGRVDPALLMEVGTCPIVLRRPPPDPEMSGVLVHDLKNHGSIVCYNSGIVEPITFSILKFIRTTDMDISEWLAEALARESLPLTARLDIAFRHLAEGGDKADWAKEILERHIKPAFAKFPALH
jgi:hypothetical protein